ncbi:hypothetical protein [Salinimicrobium oceani]|uniref:Uncharacterized protein n=1 Tax=Salinimicrobium oceani TaxID=2722702 RepID=A0ABX1CVX4_9FLAO|nr:hypothetical protein [Salinimicrobium oceani]NJW52445.1 hypothetical protein [Salinimicrobium oceani]
MEKLSEGLWKEIRFHQKLPLLDHTQVSGKGNGFNDRLSFESDRVFESKEENFLDRSKFKTIYLRNLANRADPSLSKERMFTESIKFENCTDNFIKTILLYSQRGHYRNDYTVITRAIGDWVKNLIYNGRVIIEIVSWYTNDTKQFYGFELIVLDINKCKIRRKNVLFSALKNGKIEKTKIPKSKCIIIDFPKELGGNQEFKRKSKKIEKLGMDNLFNVENPKESLEYSKNWDKQFDKIISDWGWMNRRENISDFLYAYQLLNFNNSALQCCYACIDGFKYLVSFISSKLNENAIFEISGFLDRSFYTELLEKFTKDQLPLEEVFNANNKSVMLDYL